MKKLLVALAAVVALGSATAQAQSVSIRVGEQPRYEHYQDRSYNYERRSADRRFFARQPSYYRGSRCHRWDIVIRDPYTSRLVCVNKEEYRRHQRRGAGHY